MVSDGRPHIQIALTSCDASRAALEGALDVCGDTIWVARDLGYRSGRRTGIPVTDEVQLEGATAMTGNIQPDRATSGRPSRSARRRWCGAALP
jgi:hypothetical protein